MHSDIWHQMEESSLSCFAPQESTPVFIVDKVEWCSEPVYTWCRKEISVPGQNLTLVIHAVAIQFLELN